MAASAELSTTEDEVSMEIIELMCNPCAAQIVGKSRLVPGVTRVSMVLASKTLTVRFDRALVARDKVIASVEQIVARLKASNYGFRTLIHEIVQSRVFLNK